MVEREGDSEQRTKYFQTLRDQKEVRERERIPLEHANHNHVHSLNQTASRRRWSGLSGRCRGRRRTMTAFAGGWQMISILRPFLSPCFVAMEGYRRVRRERRGRQYGRRQGTTCAVPWSSALVSLLPPFISNHHFRGAANSATLSPLPLSQIQFLYVLAGACLRKSQMKPSDGLNWGIKVAQRAHCHAMLPHPSCFHHPPHSVPQIPHLNMAR